jgi:hypothetical protein
MPINSIACDGKKDNGNRSFFTLFLSREGGI